MRRSLLLRLRLALSRPRRPGPATLAAVAAARPEGPLLWFVIEPVPEMETAAALLLRRLRQQHVLQARGPVAAPRLHPVVLFDALVAVATFPQRLPVRRAAVVQPRDRQNFVTDCGIGHRGFSIEEGGRGTAVTGASEITQLI